MVKNNNKSSKRSTNSKNNSNKNRKNNNSNNNNHKTKNKTNNPNKISSMNSTRWESRKWTTPWLATTPLKNEVNPTIRNRPKSSKTNISNMIINNNNNTNNIDNHHERCKQPTTTTHNHNPRFNNYKILSKHNKSTSIHKRTFTNITNNYKKRIKILVISMTWSQRNLMSPWWVTRLKWTIM